MRLKIVVLPAAPFGPMRPRISPFSIAKVMCPTAWRPPKRFVTSFSSRRLMRPPFRPRQTARPARRALVPHPKIPFGKKMMRMMIKTPKNEMSGLQPDTEDLRDEDVDDRPDRRPPEGCDAAQHRHEDHHDRDVVDREDDVRVDETHVVQVERSRHAGEEGADEERIELVPRRVDTQRLGAVLVLANREEVVAELAPHDERMTTKFRTAIARTM